MAYICKACIAEHELRELSATPGYGPSGVGLCEVHGYVHGDWDWHGVTIFIHGIRSACIDPESMAAQLATWAGVRFLARLCALVPESLE